MRPLQLPASAPTLTHCVQRGLRRCAPPTVLSLPAIADTAGLEFCVRFLAAAIARQPKEAAKKAAVASGEEVSAIALFVFDTSYDLVAPVLLLGPQKK